MEGWRKGLKNKVRRKGQITGREREELKETRNNGREEGRDVIKGKQEH